MPHSALINENYEGVIMKSYDQFFFSFVFSPQFNLNFENDGVVNCTGFIIKELPVWNFGARCF